MQYRSSWMTEELDAVRDQFRKFLANDLAPHAEEWRQQKMVDRLAWRSLGEMGALLASVPEVYGGLGATFAYDAAVFEDIESVVPEALSGVVVSSGIVAHYILNYGSEEQKRRWLPGMARGDLIGAIAMTEPGTGSDLQSVRTRVVKATATSSTARRRSLPTGRPPISSLSLRAQADRAPRVCR
jgi:acyl-CoA dehydrogenase